MEESTSMIKKMKIYSQIKAQNISQKCPFCVFVFKNDTTLCSHFKENHDFLSFSCYVCHKFFSNLTLLVDHMKKHNVFNPDKMQIPIFDLSKNEPTKIGYLLEKRKIQEASDLKDVNRNHDNVHERKKFLKSTISNTVFETQCLPAHEEKNTLNLNDYNVTYITLNGIKYAIYDEKLGNLIKCNKCDVGFTTKPQLDIHVKQVHEREKLYKCTICDAKFYEVGLLNKHKKGHDFDETFETRRSNKEYIDDEDDWSDEDIELELETKLMENDNTKKTKENIRKENCEERKSPNKSFDIEELDDWSDEDIDLLETRLKDMENDEKNIKEDHSRCVIGIIGQ